jgi:hypothetical protein
MFHTPQLFSIFCCIRRRSSLSLPLPTPELEGNPLSAVCDCLFNIFATTFRIQRPSPLSAMYPHQYVWQKGKAVPLQGWSGPQGSRKLWFPVYMTTAQDCGKVVSLTHRLPLPPGNAPGTHFRWRLSRPQGHSAIGRIMSMENSNGTIWNRTSDLPICSTVP